MRICLHAAEAIKEGFTDKFLHLEQIKMHL